MDLDEVRSRLRAVAPPAPAPHAFAAVATILRPTGAGVEVLFIERASREGDPWSGHVAFPGGRAQPSDASLVETAIRETREEVGVVLAPGACLAQLSDVAARSSAASASQYVFEVGEGTEAGTSDEAVASFWVPLDRLARFEGAGTFTWKRDGFELKLPCIHLGSRVLWGMTYRMMVQLLEALGVEVPSP